jgi:hypothetical protein
MREDRVFRKKKYDAISSTDMLDIIPVRTDRYDLDGHVSVVTHERFQLDIRARIALGLIERWGQVAGEIDGEDSAGRAKLRLATPAEVVNRACDCAQGAMDAFISKGWTVKTPSLSDLQDKIMENENEREKENG